ncbi:mono-functional DNA-alkylating methyl methanesulfonate N-term-domain-containing protein [Phyllosticta capitalensis]|uniref:mono-functional DNA-alkylating methyl methanesulfonate N-term-domain-containing protein n=1 Tax=Phyllosticta capitalensis TaxID=121624 RepID=UPI003130195D
MALQTGVLENGQWVTRNVDIYQLLALQNRLREDQPPRNPAPAEPAMDQPTVGLLSRTVLRSPIINWIIPARIRHREKNDVVFIGEDFIHLKEVLPDANLRHVCTKADFGSRIRAARIFGEPRKFIHPDLQHLLTAEQAQAHAESVDSIPPQFLVLTLESREMLFLFAREREDGYIEWIETSLPLHPDVSVLESPGKHLAVDPRSRALAVGSSCNCILLYSAKSMQEVRKTMPSDPAVEWWTPLRTEMPIQVRGVIMKMEFLFPDPDHDTQVILIVLYARQGKTRMSCYVWDHSLSPKTIKCVLEGYPISSRQQRPQLLMPLQQGSAFVLVGQKEIDMYQNVLDQPRRTNAGLSNPEPARFPGNSRRFPLWTSWARTDRNFGRYEENFYLIREDGVVTYLAVNNQSGALASWAGNINCSVSTAFASLDVGPALDSPDVLIAAGDSSQGEVVKIGSWKDEIPVSERTRLKRTRAQIMQPDFITSVPNWSPTLDFIVANQPGNKSGVTSTRKRIISTSGRTPYGSLSELRIGYNAKIGLFEEDPIFSGVTGLWSLRDASEKGVFFLLSLPVASELLHVSDDAQELDMEFDEETCGLDLSLPTLTCANIENGLALQITSRSLVVVETFRSNRTLPRIASWQLVDEEILAASISPENSTAYFAVRTADGFQTRTMRVESRGEEVKFEAGGAKPLQSDPTCVQWLRANSKRLLLCATADGLIQLHGIHPNGSLGDILMSQNVQGGANPRSLAACQSAMILCSSSARAGGTDMALVCGLRNGDLYVVDMSETTQNGFAKGDGNSPRTRHEASHGKLCFGKTTRTSLGHTPVVLFEDPECGSLSGFATCGSEFHRLNLNSGESAGLEVTNIWLTDRIRPYLQQKPVSSICRIPHERFFIRGLGGALICISGSAIYIVHLGEEKNMVPRSIPVRGSPNRVISCPSLKALFVSCNEPVAFEVTDKNGTKRARFRESFVQMFDERSDASNSEPAAEYYLPAGWRINALSAMEFEGHQGKKYCQIVVGAAIASKTEDKAGRVLFLTRKNRENSRPELVQLKELKFREQVTSLYGDANSLIVCFGRKVHLYMFSAESKSLRLAAETEIPSLGIHVTTEDNHVYISTASDSLLVYQIFEDESAGLTHRFELLFTDSQARDTSCHVRLPLSQSEVDPTIAQNNSSHTTDTPHHRENSVALVSDKRGSVAVLYLPHRRTYQTAVPTLVEAALPRSVMRLRHSAPPQPSKAYTPDSRPPGIIADDVLGAASDGTFFNFSLVEEATWRLLKFLENMCKLQEQERRSRRPGSQLSPMMFDSRATNDLIIAPLRHLDQYDDSHEDVLAATAAAAASRSNLAQFDVMDLDVDSEPAAGGPVLQPLSRQSAASSSYSSTAVTLLRALDPDKNRTGLKRRTAYHIDGDILGANFVGRRAEESLLASLKMFCGGANVAVWKRFVEVVDAALKVNSEGEQGHANENDGDGIRAFEGMDISGARSDEEARAARQGERNAQMRRTARLVVEWLKRFMDPVL